MRLSYSQYRTYIQCPRKYKNELDRVEPPVEPNMYFALYGKLIESFFKKYTNYYTKNNIQLNDMEIREALKKHWKYILDNNYVDWNEPFVSETADQIFETAYVDTLGNMEKFNFWKESRSEVSIEINLKKSGDVLSTRLDFIWEKPDSTIEIIDGKGTMKVDKNVDVEQLFFYSLIYLLSKRKLPDKLGFLYYRYKMIKYVDFDIQTIMDFKDKLSVVKSAIKADTVYEPKVGLSKQCKWCPYKCTCSAYTKVREDKNAKKEEKLNIPYEGTVVDFSPR